MRTLFHAAALVILSATASVAQPTGQSVPKRQTYDAALLDENARITECMKQWDRSTHMTKKEWEATCRRVAKERIKHLREQGYGAEPKKPAPRNKPSQM
jgi:hypothetical protein